MNTINIFSISDSILNHWIAGLKEKYRVKIHKRVETLKGLEGILLFHGNSSISLLDDLRNIHNNNPGLKVFVLTDIPGFQEGETLLATGIKGYGNARIHPAALQQATELIENGNHWFYPDFTQHIVSAVVSRSETTETGLLERLSERERDAAILVVDGLHNKEIAEKMGITERTVKAHLGAIFAKLGVKDRIGLVLLLRGK